MEATDNYSKTFLVDGDETSYEDILENNVGEMEESDFEFLVINLINLGVNDAIFFEGIEYRRLS